MKGNIRTRALRHLCTAFWVTVVAATSSGASVAAQYKLAAGDTLEVSIGGLPDQRYRLQIQDDGTIAFPGIGAVEVSGLTPAEFQARMEALLRSRVLRQRAPNGGEQPFVVKPGDVMTSVAEYRPIYVTGDVLTPGQQVYRAAMTVRQVVAVAGGFSLLRSRGQTPGATDPADLVRDYQSFSTEYVKEFIHVQRTNAELRDQDKFDASIPREISLPASAIDPIVQAEAQSLKTAVTDNRNERAFLEDAVKQADAQLVTLKKQQEAEEKGVQADEEELDRVIKLFGQGSLPSPRVAESRRALLLSSTRRLQTQVEVMRLQRQREDSLRQIDRVGSLRTVNLLKELKDSNARMADLRVRMQALSQRLQPIGGAGAVPLGMSELQPEVTIIRKVGQRWDRIAASVDFDVEPGDVVDVALRASAATNASN
ncbi:polysaccharide biosynthesis/export family protein [Bradyrhizobium erythrophlei]|uniref:polysaccharide biosynthesis/export family protein n=1 Tax=Bradyrhizobium erythrophlei TaxID=1437360 RepID=UPI0035F0EFAC